MSIIDSVLKVLKVIEESTKLHSPNEKEIEEIEEIINYLENS